MLPIGSTKGPTVTTTATDPYAAYWGYYGIPSTGDAATIIRQRIASGESPADVFMEFAAIMKTGPFAGGGDGGGEGVGVGTTAWSSTQAAAEQQQAWETAEAEKNRQLERDRLTADIAQDKEQLAWLEKQFGMEQANLDARQREMLAAEMERLKLSIDNSQRELAYGEYAATKRTVIQEQGATQRDIMKLGPDPFRQQAAMLGQVQRGLTPQQQAVIPAMQFMNQPLPDVSINAPIPEIQGALAGLQGMKPPSFGGFGMSAPIGLAEGGIFGMNQGTKPQSFLVGDAAGVIPGVTEVITIGDGKVQVTPLAGGAQGGLSMEQTLSPMLTAAGFSPGTTPRFTTYDPIGGYSTGSTAPELMRLGLIP